MKQNIYYKVTKTKIPKLLTNKSIWILLLLYIIRFLLIFMTIENYIILGL